MNEKIKGLLLKSPKVYAALLAFKFKFKLLQRMKYYAHDISITYGAMNWSKNSLEYTVITSELLFYYHKLEKGLVMPGKKRLFGIEPAIKTMELITMWEEKEPVLLNDGIYNGAIGTLQSYRDRLVELNLDPNDVILSRLDSFFINRERNQTGFTPTSQKLLDPSVHNSGMFSDLMNARRSVRDYKDDLVSKDIIDLVVDTTRLSPSACNRQPCSVIILTEKEDKDRLLKLQNGNAGFGHLAPHVAAIVADSCCFFDASERNQPFIDGGMFSMSFILALKANNVDSCCLNWCVSPAIDIEAHALLNIPKNKRIIMLVAFGYGPENILVPRSPRRDVENILSYTEEA
jgi:nitroreductase